MSELRIALRDYLALRRALGYRLKQTEWLLRGLGGSIQFGTNMTPAAPGSAQVLHLIVFDVAAAGGGPAGRSANVNEESATPRTTSSSRPAPRRSRRRFRDSASLTQSGAPARRRA